MKNWLRHFDQLSAVFTGVKECEIWPRFEGSGFEREQATHRKSIKLIAFFSTYVCIFSFLIHATIIWWIKMYKQQLWVCAGFCVLPELDIVRSSQLPRTTYSPPPPGKRAWKIQFIESSMYSAADCPIVLNFGVYGWTGLWRLQKCWICSLVYYEPPTSCKPQNDWHDVRRPRITQHHNCHVL